jgi:hypothetical protein
MPVPIASMYEHRRMISWKQEIGITGKMPVPETIPEAQSMQAATENPFRFRIGATYLGHVRRAMFLGELISHRTTRAKKKGGQVFA